MAATASWPASIDALEEIAEVAREALDDRGRVEDADPAGGGRDRAGVADLATALGVKRRPVQEDLDQLGAVREPSRRRCWRTMVRPSSQRPRGPGPRPLLGLVAEELGGAELETDLAPGGGDLLGPRGTSDAGPARLAGTAALLFHRHVEALAGRPRSPARGRSPRSAR